MNGEFLGIDWGTTNRRVYRIKDGVVQASERDGDGVTAVPPGTYPAEVADVRARMGDLPILMAGMVGSTIGWQAVPYVPVPAGVGEVVGGLRWIDDRTAIVPGICAVADGRGDVMRGEEVQLLGAVAAGLAPPDALLVQPGTHCKWARVAGGTIAGFTTAMTGELFALLRRYSVLKTQLDGEAAVGQAFLAGVDEARRGDLLASLFGIRAAGVLGLRDDADAASYASGLLIGADVAARLAGSSIDCVHLLADPALGSLYVAAVEAHGRDARLIESEDVFVAGIHHIWSSIA